MCGVEGAEYGFAADIRVARDDYYRCAAAIFAARGPSQRVPAGRRGRGGEPLDLAI
jgi:hypothetical protein